METLIAFDGPNGLSLRHDKTRALPFGVFLGSTALDWFSVEPDARKLTQDLSISRIASAGDKMLGQIRYCGDALSNGKSVIVIAKTPSGYMVQTVGTQERFEASQEELSDLPAYKFSS